MENLNPLVRSALLSASNVVQHMTWTDAVAYTAVAIGVSAVVSALRVWFSDCDLQLAAAVRRLPSHSGFEKQVVWITGASSGIGEALAYELAQRGAIVILSARRTELLMKVADKCLQLGSPESEALRLDVTDASAFKATVEYVVRKYKKIDILVNNAGRSQRGLVERTAPEVDREMFELNVLAPLALTKAVLPHMLERGAGHVVNTSSVAGKVGSPISATYAATKHAIQGFFDSMRMEVQYRGVHVTNVCPGPVHSEITLHAFTEEAGKEHGKKEDGTRMTAERCALLITAAIHAKLPEVWLAPQPILLFTYIGQYFRSAYFYLGPHKLGPQRVKAFLGGNSGYGSIQSIGGLLKTSGGTSSGSGSKAAASTSSDSSKKSK
jgi:short-subunit dehydrogenase